MSENCIECVVEKRTGGDLLCDKCRTRNTINCSACGKPNKTPQYGDVCIKCLSVEWGNGNPRGLELKPEQPKQVATGKPEWYQEEE